jgi:preprotein translocase subunit SecE
VAARNRRRARERRAQSGDDPSRLATAGQPDAEPELTGPAEPDGAPSDGLEDPPAPLEHATPDVELADAQISLGARGFVRDRDETDERYDRIYEDEVTGQEPGEVAAAVGLPTGVEPHKPGIFTRLTHFLRGSWRELQRVQWPDRRQVMQATGVVLGFVIVAGVYLGFADFVAQKFVNLIIK